MRMWADTIEYLDTNISPRPSAGTRIDLLSLQLMKEEESVLRQGKKKNRERLIFVKSHRKHTI